VSRKSLSFPKTSKEPAFSRLSASQRRAVEESAAPLCIIAGPGSGKTRVLTLRIANRIDNGSARANHIVAVTFTRKAAAELRQRLHSLGVFGPLTAGTFHGIALASLRQWYADRSKELPRLLGQPTHLLETVMADLHFNCPPTTPAREAASLTPLVRAVAGEIGWAKARMLHPTEYPEQALQAQRQLPIHPELIAKVFSLYEQAKRRRHLMDLNDILSLCIAELHEQPTFAAIIQWRFKHLFVDEFQDINPLQLSLLKEWLGGDNDLCLVGDPAQSIYGWNGADSSLFIKLPEEFPGIKVVTLEENFRSTPQIVHLANAVYPLSLYIGPSLSSATIRTDVDGLGAQRILSHVSPSSSATVSSWRAEEEVLPLPVVQESDGPLPTFECYETDQEEASALSKIFATAHRSHLPWSEMAVLARTNAQLGIVSQTLSSLGIPHRVIGSSGSPRKGGKLNSLIRMARTYRDRPLSYLIADLAAETQGGHDPVASSLLEVARDYSTLDPRATVRNLIDFLVAHRLEGVLDDPDSDSVSLTTFHRAKGLEWSKVFLIGLEDGLVPMHTAVSSEQLLEERRLLYVAITRARKELHLSWVRRRTVGETVVERRVSPFAEEVLAAISYMRPAVIPRERLKKLLDEEVNRLRTR